ncbi:MAG TPA: OFA family MFS transporter [Bryobacteraceae bacterium]
MTVSSPAQRSLPRWHALVGGGLVNVAIGTYYAWSVFVPALEKDFGWNRAQTSWVPTINMVTLALSFVTAGFLQRRIGPRAVATIGGLVYSLGLLLASFIHTLPELYLTWGLMVGVGCGFGYLPPITVGSKWFPDHRGLVNGLAIGIFAAGSGIFGPIAGYFIGQIGWREVFQGLAALFFVFTMAGSYLLKDPPEGYTAPAAEPRTLPRRPFVSPDMRTSEMLRTGRFYALWIAYALGTAAGTMVISQLIPFARLSGHTETAALAITIGAIGSASGRFFSGWLSDHFGRLPTVRAMVMLSMIVTPALYLLRENEVLFFGLLLLVYYCYGTQLSVYTALAGDFWGTRYLATNYGVMLCAWGFAGVMGPQLGSRVYVATGSYRYAFFGAAMLALTALIILSLVRAPKKIELPLGAATTARA